jgi:hypothetical protein
LEFLGEAIPEKVILSLVLLVISLLIKLGLKLHEDFQKKILLCTLKYLALKFLDRLKRYINIFLKPFYIL